MTQEFVTLPREVLERTLDTLGNAETVSRKQYEAELFVITAIRAALEHPQNHVPDAGNMVPAGWKLVPVEPTHEIISAMLESEAQDDEGKFPTLFDLLDFSGANKALMVVAAAYRAMLDAAPQPPTVKECLTVEQPQANQPAMTPIAQRKLEDLMANGYTISGYSVYHERKHQHGFVTGAGLVGWWKPEGVEYPQPLSEQESVAWLTIEVMGPRTTVDVEWEDQLQKLPSGIYKLYTNPQPKSDASGKPDEWFDRLKAAHNIK